MDLYELFKNMQRIQDPEVRDIAAQANLEARQRFLDNLQRGKNEQPRRDIQQVKRRPEA